MKELTIEQRFNLGKGQRGKKFSDEHKQKLSAAKKGIPKTPEHRAAMSLAQQRRYQKQSQE